MLNIQFNDSYVSRLIVTYDDIISNLHIKSLDINSDKTVY